MALLGILFGSSALVAAYLVLLNPNYYYSIALPNATVAQLINQLKTEHKELATPAFTVNGNTYQLPVLVESNSSISGSSHFNVFNATDSTFFVVNLYENEDKETRLKFSYIGYAGRTYNYTYPYPRKQLALKRNTHIENTFRNLFLNKLQAKLDSAFSAKSEKIKIRRTLL